jgi:spore coat polysaccharide biosynthesis protein SpsF
MDLKYKKNIRVGCIVQARTGSKRLPKKVLKPILGKPLITRVLERVMMSDCCQNFIIATTDKISDDAIIPIIDEFNNSAENKVHIYRGSENNVLDRFYETAKKFNFDVIIRVTGDNPVIDYRIIDRLFRKIVSNNQIKNDYVSTRITARSWPYGLDSEIFSFDALKKSWEADTSEYEREHVTPYMSTNPGLFKLIEMRNEHDYSHIRLSVDTIEDFDIINKIYESLYFDNPTFSMINILDHLNVSVK